MRHCTSGVARVPRLPGQMVGMATCYYKGTLTPALNTWGSYLLLKLTKLKIIDKRHWQLYSTWHNICTAYAVVVQVSWLHMILPGLSEIHQSLDPYGPGCSYATALHIMVVAIIVFAHRASSCAYVMVEVGLLCLCFETHPARMVHVNS